MSFFGDLFHPYGLTRKERRGVIRNVDRKLDEAHDAYATLAGRPPISWRMTARDLEDELGGSRPGDRDVGPHNR